MRQFVVFISIVAAAIVKQAKRLFALRAAVGRLSVSNALGARAESWGPTAQMAGFTHTRGLLSSVLSLASVRRSLLMGLLSGQKWVKALLG